MSNNKIIISVLTFSAIASILIVATMAFSSSAVPVEPEAGTLDGVVALDDPDSSNGYIEFKNTTTNTCANSLGAKLAKRGITLGAAVDSRNLKNNQYANVVTCHFNGVVAENDMKWDPIQKNQGQFNFTAADEIVDFATANGKSVRGHTLIWHNIYQAGFAQNLPCNQLLDAMEKHITTTMTRYRGRVTQWDVVNEAVADGNSGALRTGRSATGSFWHDCLGDSYIEKAFQFARAADPDAKLYYNDYAINNAAWPKHKRVRKIVSQLKAKGLIDGVGIQSHLEPFKYDYSAADYKAGIQSFADLGVDVAITEIDVNIKGHTNDLNRQAYVYKTALEGCLAVSACKTFYIWGVSDNRTWLPNGAPLIFNKQYQAKPAYDAMMSLL